MRCKNTGGNFVYGAKAECPECHRKIKLRHQRDGSYGFPSHLASKPAAKTKWTYITPLPDEELDGRTRRVFKAVIDAKYANLPEGFQLMIAESRNYHGLALYACSTEVTEATCRIMEIEWPLSRGWRYWHSDREKYTGQLKFGRSKLEGKRGFKLEFLLENTPDITSIVEQVNKDVIRHKNRMAIEQTESEFAQMLKIAPNVRAHVRHEGWRGGYTVNLSLDGMTEVQVRELVGMLQLYDSMFKKKEKN